MSTPLPLVLKKKSCDSAPDTIDAMVVSVMLIGSSRVTAGKLDEFWQAVQPGLNRAVLTSTPGSGTPGVRLTVFENGPKVRVLWVPEADASTTAAVPEVEN